MDKDLLAPPTPSRVGIRRYPGMCGEDDESLASLTGEVVEAQKFQTNELSDKKSFLNTLQMELENANKVYLELEEYTKSLNRKLFQVQDKASAIRVSCSGLQNEVIRTLDERRVMRTKLVEKQFEAETLSATRNKYNNTMTTFRQHVNNFSQQSTLYQQVEQLKKQILTNQQTIDSFPAVEYAEVAVDKQVLDVLSNEIKISQHQANNLKEMSTCLTKEIDALHKRNAAQLTRLKRALQEESARASKWRNEVDALKERLDEKRNELNVLNGTNL